MQRNDIVGLSDIRGRETVIQQPDTLRNPIGMARTEPALVIDLVVACGTGLVLTSDVPYPAVPTGLQVPHRGKKPTFPTTVLIKIGCYTLTPADRLRTVGYSLLLLNS